MVENCHEKLIKTNFLGKRVAELSTKAVCAICYIIQVKQSELISIIQLFPRSYI